VAGAGIGVGLALARSPSPSRSQHPRLRAQFQWAAGARRAPDFTLRDQSSRLLSLHALRGRVVLLTFLDSRCRLLCPLEARAITAVASGFPAAARPTLVVVSADPWKDTPRSEHAFAAHSRWNLRWHWLNGSTATLGRVWRNYSIGVKPTKGDITHSTGVYLIDRAGYERAGYLVPFAPAAMASDVRTLAGT
jgi:protein SCO1/2